MKESKVDAAEVVSEPVTPRRPKPSLYHFLLGYVGILIVAIPMMLMMVVEFSPVVEYTFLVIAFPILMTWAWWMVTRSDRYQDEFELANTREIESIAFRLMVFGIVALDLLIFAGVEWDYPLTLTLAPCWYYAGIRTNRRIKKQMQASQPPVRKCTHG
jgi:hypothetical protein